MNEKNNQTHDANDASRGSTGSSLITVVICTHNRAHWLEKTVQSVLDQISDGTELLVIDNASTDETPSVVCDLTRTHPSIFVWREERLGVAFARNTALAKAKGEYVLFLDDDEIAEPGWLTAYTRFIAEHNSVRLGCVGGPSIPFFEKTPPRWIDPARFGLDLGEPARLLAGVNSLGAGNSAYRRLTALRLGGFCTALARHEDSELNGRLQAAGYEVWWLPNARMRHHIPASRLTLAHQSRLAFAEGSASAVVRLRQIKCPISRWFYCLGRSVVAPFHVGLKLVLAGITLPWRHGRIAARTWLHVPRTWGVVFGLWTQRRHCGKNVS